MQTELKIAQRERINALANDLATEAMRSLDGSLAAYTRGALDNQTGRVVCAVSDISVLKNIYLQPADADAILGNANICLFNPS